MVRNRQDDTLFIIAQFGIAAYVAVCVIAMLIVAAATAAMGFSPSEELAAQMATAPALALPAILFSAALTIATLILAIFFALALRGIVATVRHGDPFDPANIVRLERMGGYAMLATMANWTNAAVARWLSHHFDESEVTYTWAFGGIVLTATMFILARVFRHGAAMREDLAGTV